jgi:hypothetical protein
VTAAGPGGRPAFYAAGPGPWRDWWTLLHPPYTAWHLSYVLLGAALAAPVNITILLGTLLAFFLAVGVAAHALDELRGRPLQTSIPSAALVAAAAIGLLGALALGVAGVVEVGWALVPFLVVGPVLVLGYNLELFSGALHSDVMFAAGWGAFPVLTSAVAQSGDLGLAPIAGAAGAFALSWAQRRLSTPARALRRRVVRVQGTATTPSGEVPIDRAALLAPLEQALGAMSWAIVLITTAMVIARAN